MEKGTVLYKMASDFRLLAFTFLRMEGSHYIFEHDDQVIKRNQTFFDQLSFSKIVLLTEVEDTLKNQLNIVHQQMREHKVQFNPADEVMKIYAFAKSNEVHQYDKQGNYIQSFRSVTSALKQMGIKNLKNGSISQVCQNKPEYKTAFGFRWSFERVDKLL